MVRPSLFDLYNNQQIMETKMNTYKAIIDNEEFSKITAMKKILGYTDNDVEENFRNLAKEKCLTELAEYWSGKVNSEGPAGEYDKPPIPIKGISDKEEEAAEGGDEEGGDSGEEGEEAPEAEADDKGEAEEPAGQEQEEAPAPTFGLS